MTETFNDAPISEIDAISAELADVLSGDQVSLDFTELRREDCSLIVFLHDLFKRRLIQSKTKMVGNPEPHSYKLIPAKSTRGDVAKGCYYLIENTTGLVLHTFTHEFHGGWIHLQSGTDSWEEARSKQNRTQFAEILETAAHAKPKKIEAKKNLEVLDGLNPDSVHEYLMSVLEQEGIKTYLTYAGISPKYSIDAMRKFVSNIRQVPSNNIRVPLLTRQLKNGFEWQDVSANKVFKIDSMPEFLRDYLHLGLQRRYPAEWNFDKENKDGQHYRSFRYWNACLECLHLELQRYGLGNLIRITEHPEGNLLTFADGVVLPAELQVKKMIYRGCDERVPTSLRQKLDDVQAMVVRQLGQDGFGSLLNKMRVGVLELSNDKFDRSLGSKAEDWLLNFFQQTKQQHHDWLCTKVYAELLRRAGVFEAEFDDYYYPTSQPNPDDMQELDSDGIIATARSIISGAQVNQRKINEQAANLVGLSRRDLLLILSNEAEIAKRPTYTMAILQILEQKEG